MNFPEINDNWCNLAKQSCAIIKLIYFKWHIFIDCSTHNFLAPLYRQNCEQKKTGNLMFANDRYGQKKKYPKMEIEVAKIAVYSAVDTGSTTSADL